MVPIEVAEEAIEEEEEKMSEMAIMDNMTTKTVEWEVEMAIMDNLVIKTEVFGEELIEAEVVILTLLKKRKNPRITQIKLNKSQIMLKNLPVT